MKRALILISFCLTFSYLSAGEDWQKFPVGPFSGLNNRDNSYAIPSQNAQDLLNVELTPGGKSVRKRKGYGIAWTMSQTTSAVHGVYDFFDSNGNEVNLFFNDSKITASVGGAAATVLLSTAPNGATWQCTDTLGQAYCVNTSRTGLYKISGSTLSQIMTVVSTGTMIATAVDRLVMSGFSDAPNRIDFSAASDFTTWGTGSLGTSGVQVTVSAPGAKVTHIDYTFGRVMWFKDTSFGYVLIGVQPLQTDWVNKTVAFDVGTNDNSFVYREGILYFRGKDSHIYQFDGNTYQRLSREISGTINTSQTRSQNSWTQTSQSDWISGNLSDPSGVFLDTQTVSGLIQPTFPDTFSSFKDGTNSSKNVWLYGYGFGSILLSTVIANGSLVFVSTPDISVCGSGSNCYSSISSYSPLNTYTTGTTYYFEINDLVAPAADANKHDIYFVLKQGSQPDAGTQSSPTSGTYWWLQFTSSNTSPRYLNFVKMQSNTGSPSITTYNASNPMPLTFSMYIDTTNVQYTINGSSIIYRGTHSWTIPTNSLYAALWVSKESGVGGGPTHTSTITLDNFSVAPQTATWSSSIHGAPNLTSWDAFAATTLQTGGTQTFGIRSATFQFVNGSTWPYTAVNSGSVPSVSVSTWFQVKDYFAATSTGVIDPLYDFTQNWFEGSAADKAYATYFDDRILWSITTGTSTTNNRILDYDLLNQTWLLWDLPSNGFYIKANKLYFGSSNGGYVYKYGDVDDDNGAAINSYWKSKDYFGGDPFTTQELANISLIADQVSNSSVTVSYTTNGSSTSSFYFPLTSSKAFVGLNKNLPAGTIGSNFNIQVGNNAADQPWEIFGIQVGIRPKSWIPGGP